MARRATTHVEAMIALLAGCRTAHQTRDPEFAQVSRAVHRAMYAPLDSPEEFVNPVVSELEGSHAVEEYIRFALQQNPDIQAARKNVEAFAHQVPVAASLPDPMLNVTVQPEQVQTAAGPQDLILSASQRFHWFGKLGSRANVAEAQTNVARARLAATELATIAKVKRAYYELYYIQHAISVTEAEQRLLGDIRDVANTRYMAGRTSQQDVVRAELEISNVEKELIQLRQQLESGRARLAQILHVAPQTQLRALDRLPPEQAPQDLDALQAQAIAARPELHAQLASLERDRRSVELARLDYKPDLTLGLSWIDVANAGLSPVANGRDSLLLTAGVTPSDLPEATRFLRTYCRSKGSFFGPHV